MALSQAVNIEVRPGGNDTNGGGFLAGAAGTDWTLQDSPQYSVTDGVTAGSTTITSATANFGADVVGNLIYVQGGTGAVTANWYQITSRTNSTTIVVDRSTGLTAGTGVTLKIGGAMATPGGATAIPSLVFGNKIWVKYSSTPYSITTATAGPDGPIRMATTVTLTMIGYDQVRGDRANMPTIQWNAGDPGSSTYMAVMVGNTRQMIVNMIFDGNNTANVNGINTGVARVNAMQCIVKNFTGSGCIGIFSLAATTNVFACYAINCTIGFSAGYFDSCVAISCTTGFSSVGYQVNCLAILCTNGFSSALAYSFYKNCTADRCTTAGFVATGTGMYQNCISTNQNGGAGKGFSVGSYLATLSNCAVYNNTSNITGTPIHNEGFITLTANPYVDAANNDYRLNTMAGGGALLRNAGIGTYGQINNVDIGAVQHSDPVGGAVSIGF